MSAKPAVRPDRKITRDDIEASCKELQGEVDERAEAVKVPAIAIAVGVAVVTIAAAYLLGRRKGKSARPCSRSGASDVRDDCSAGCRPPAGAAAVPVRGLADRGVGRRRRSGSCATSLATGEDILYRTRVVAGDQFEIIARPRSDTGARRTLRMSAQNEPGADPQARSAVQDHTGDRGPEVEPHMKVVLRNPRRELEFPAPRTVAQLLTDLDVVPESVLVIRNDTLVTTRPSETTWWRSAPSCPEERNERRVRRSAMNVVSGGAQ